MPDRVAAFPKGDPFHPDTSPCLTACTRCARPLFVSPVLRRADYRVLCEVMAGRQGQSLRFLRKSLPRQESRQPARFLDRLHSLSLVRSPRRMASRSCLTSCPPPHSVPPSGPCFGLSLVPRLSPSQLTHQHRQGRGAHREPHKANQSPKARPCRRAVTASRMDPSTSDPYHS